jgi:thiamine pyrophosphate-dependent acetolactate synthase large subunit-like protein
MATDRRAFLKGFALASAAALGNTMAASAAQAQGAPGTAEQSAAAATAGQSVAAARPPLSATVIDRPGSDFMVDVIKSLGLEYIASNPGSSFRSLQESIINYGGNANPEFITCLHEESSAAIAHGYAKAAGKPMGILAHGTVGLQHASMGIYNAWADRVPMMVMAGNVLDATKRRAGVEWYHSVQDAASFLRDFTKWDDQPASLQHFAESMVRAYKISTTPPMEPVVIVADGDLQEGPIEAGDTPLQIPKLTAVTPPQGDAGALAEAARMLVNAEAPVILADRVARTPEGLSRLVELAETLNAPVVDLGGRMNFPNTHYLSLSEMKGQLIRNADLVLGLEVGDLWGQLNAVGDPFHDYRRIAKPDVKVLSINVSDLYTKSNYQDFQRFTPTDLSIAGDVEATLPALTEAVRSAMSTERRSALSDRASRFRSMSETARQASRTAAAVGWETSPVTTARLAAEVGAAVQGEDWSLAVGGSSSGWTNRLWSMTQPYHHFGGSGGAGVGYAAGAAVGIALANRAKGRFTVAIQPDGDLMYAPGVLWTAAHHRVPLLFVMYNNRSYHQEMMHLQRMAGMHDRRMDQAQIGTGIYDPYIDYAKLAQSMGVWAEGPISNPAELAAVLQRAVQMVKSGVPALVDVVCQPR